MSEARWQGEVLDFWFGQPKERWFAKDAAFDAEITERFGDLWREQRSNPASVFLTSPDDALAAIILFDQFPRNMFRDHADSFATDPLARAIADGAIDKGYDETLPPERRGFVYLPFEHSEDPGDQQRSVALFTTIGDPELLRYAKLHHDVIARFGRFPHRNKMLGRQPRADEVAAGDVTPF